MPPALHTEIEELALLSEHPPPAVTRVLFSDADLAARAWFRSRCLAAGLSWRTDEVGNAFARWPGSDPALPAVATGSHLDAIPHAGKYDGVVGVLGGLEAIRQLQAGGFSPRRSIELICFTAEEPTRFGIGCLGSRMLSGALAAGAAERLRDAEGRGLDEWRKRGGHQGDLADVRRPPGTYEAFVELHIEQGPLLEASGTDIGVVEKIAAPAAFRLQFTGAGGHAGAVLMPDRNDALLAAAEVALAVEQAARTSGSPDTVATCGVLEVKPGAINSIPCDVKLEIDLRDTDMPARDRTEQTIRQAAAEVCQRRNIGLAWHTLHADAAAHCPEPLVARVEEQARALGFGVRRMTSRAYHDALFVSRIAPMTMIFIPCRQGHSHRPDEYSSPEAIDKGVAVLAATLRSLSR